MLLPLLRFAKVDKRHVDRRTSASASAAESPSSARHLRLREANMQIGRHGHVHHLRIRQVEVVHEFDIFIDRLDLKPRIERLFFADRADCVALVVVRRKDQRFVRQLEQFAEDANSYCARGSPFWKSVRPVPRISNVSPVKTRSARRKL